MTPKQAAAIARLSSFVESYAAMGGQDPEYVYSIHAGPDGGRSEHIRISDLRALLTMVTPTPTETPPMPFLLTPPPADRFRVGDVWRSPRLKDWQCDKIENGLARLRSLRNRKNTQWRGVMDTGKDIDTAWLRISPPDALEPPTNAQ